MSENNSIHASMERKFQNFQSRRRCVHQDKTKKKEIKRSNSVHPLLRASTNKTSTDDSKKCKNTHDSLCSYHSLASELPKRRERTPSESPASDDSATKYNICTGRAKTNNKKLKQSYCSSTETPRNVVKNSEETLKAELSRCKKELSEYNNATKELEQKYLKINVELGEMQQRHEQFLADRSADKSCGGIDRSPTGSEYSIKRKHTQVYERTKNIILLLSGKEDAQESDTCTEDTALKTQHHIKDDNFMTTCRHNKQQISEKIGNYHNKRAQLKPQLKKKDPLDMVCKEQCDQDSLSFFDTPTTTSSELSSHKHFSNRANLNRIYETLQQAINSENKDFVEPSNPLVPDNIRELQKTIAELHNEQKHFCNVIQQQQTHLQDYQNRCAKAKRIMSAQKSEIEKLIQSKKDLQDEIDTRLNKVRQQLDDKLRVMAPISQQLRDTNARYEKVVKENRMLMERVRTLQAQAKDFKMKLEDLTKRKAAIMTKLKNAERDLRVYKNYNVSLKAEKQKQAEEIQKTRELLESQQTANKRVLSRQRDTNDKHCRDLQRRIIELEQKLGRSNNSTSGLLQQRDRLISELQSQVNTLVHNFEISQKHIRVLRRQIVNAAGLSNNVVGITPLSKKNM